MAPRWATPQQVARRLGVLDQAAPDQGGPGRAELDRAELDRAELDRAELDLAGPGLAELDRAEPGRAAPGLAELDRAELGQVTAHQCQNRRRSHYLREPSQLLAFSGYAGAGAPSADKLMRGVTSTPR